jgi:bacterioferritin (cytochrome b1)
MMPKSDTKCPNCGHAMRLLRRVPKLGALPALQSFGCYRCNEVVTEAIEDV